MAQSFLRAIKQIMDCSIDVIVLPAYKHMLDLMPDEIDHAFDSPDSHGKFSIKKIYRLSKQLQLRKYSRCYILRRSLKSAILPFLARIPQRIGYRGECRRILLTQSFNYQSIKNKPYLEHLLNLLGEKVFLINQKSLWPRLSFKQIVNVDAAIFTACNSRKKKKLALCIGAAFGPAKRWPVAYFKQLGLAFIQKGWDVWLLGGPDEVSLAADVNDSNLFLDFTQDTSLVDMAYLLTKATVVVSNDSGLMHMAAAIGAPTVAIYGSSSPKKTPPLSDAAKVLEAELACRPCFAKRCPLGHTRCLSELSVTTVKEAVLQLMGSMLE